MSKIVVRTSTPIFVSTGSLWIYDSSSAVWREFGPGDGDMFSELSQSASAPTNSTEIGGTDIWTKIMLGGRTFGLSGGIWSELDASSTITSNTVTALKATTPFYMYDETTGRYSKLGLSGGVFADLAQGTRIPL